MRSTGQNAALKEVTYIHVHVHVYTSIYKYSQNTRVEKLVLKRFCEFACIYMYYINLNSLILLLSTFPLPLPSPPLDHWKPGCLDWSAWHSYAPWTGLRRTSSSP